MYIMSTFFYIVCYLVRVCKFNTNDSACANVVKKESMADSIIYVRIIVRIVIMWFCLELSGSKQGLGSMI